MNNPKFCIVFGSALHPQKGGGLKVLLGRGKWEIWPKLFYLKVDIKSKTFQ